MTKLTVTFRNFANAPTNVVYIKSTHSVHQQSPIMRVLKTPRNTRCSAGNCGAASQAPSAYHAKKCAVNEAFAPALNTSSAGMTMTTCLQCLLKRHDYLCAGHTCLQCAIAAWHSSRLQISLA